MTAAREATSETSASTSRTKSSREADRLLNPRLAGAMLLFVTAAGYLALTEFVVWLNGPLNLGAGFWPSAGFSLALLL